MRTRPSLLVLTLLLVVDLARASSDLGLRPSWSDPAAVLDSLTMDDRLSLIDVYDEPLARGEEISDADRIELVRLYRWSSLMKHRVLGIELLEGLEELDYWRESVLTYERTFNPWKATEVLDAWIAARPDDTEAWTRLGMIRLEEGADDRRRGALEEAIKAFRRVLEIDPTNLDGWRGLAVVRVAQNRYDALVPIAEALVELAPRAPGSHLLSALGLEARASEHRAAAAWLRAIELMDRSTRRLFEDVDRLRVETGENVFRDDLEAPAPPRDDRGWWARLTEADLLFGRPDQGIVGWNTACGRAWTLYGRPEVMRLVEAADTDAATADPRLSPYRENIIGQMRGGRMANSAQHVAPDNWIWLVRIRDDRKFPLVFQRDTRFATWRFEPEVEEEIIDWQERKGAIRLAFTLPAVPAASIETSIDVAFHGFRGAGGRLRVEAWSALDAAHGEAVDALRMVVFDASGHELDRMVSPVDDRHRRRELARAVEGLEREVEGWLHGFGALLPVGEYLVVVDGLDAEGAVVASRDARLRLEAGVVARRDFDISDPLLCDAYAERGEYDELPAEFVRFARAVVPNPARRLRAGRADVAVYYEVYGASADGSGQSRLEIEYAVYPAAHFDPVLRTPRYVDGEIARPSVRIVFPQATTGTGPDGLVVRGTRLDVSELVAGEYVLSVLVSDRVARREAGRIVRFEVVEGDEGS